MGDTINNTTVEPTRAQGVSVTIKYGKGFEESWVGFTGTPEGVRADLIAAFDLGECEGLTLGQVVLSAQQIAHAYGSAAELGAKPLNRDKPAASASAPPWDDTPPSTPQNPNDPWADVSTSSSSAAADPQVPSDPYAELRASVEAQTSVDSLKKLYAENVQAFADPTLLAAYKAKGKALKAASS